MTGSTVFVCYSHQDGKEKDRLSAHLEVLRKNNIEIDPWSEDRTGPGADWQAEIDRVIVEARLAILFITADFLRSDFLIDKVVPALLKRREQEGLIIFPVIAKACAWRSVDWLVKMKVRPEDGKPIWSAPADYYAIEEALAKIAEEVASIVKVGKSDEALASGTALPPEIDIPGYKSEHEESHKAEIEAVSPQEEAVLRSIADRTNEFGQFERMLTDPEEEHILLIEAPGGWGKSTLLKEFMRLCRPSEMVPVDIKDRAVGLHNIFFDVYDILGWDHCARFAEAAGHLANIILAPGTPLEQTMIETALRTGESENLNTSWDKLTRALFEDLDSLPDRAILIFDAFEAAPDNVQDWFSQVFLRYASRSAKVVVVIAGRTVPAETITWSCHRRTLPPIDDPILWQDYCRQVGLVGLKNEWIEGFCELFKGNTKGIVEALETVGQGG